MADKKEHLALDAAQRQDLLAVAEYIGNIHPLIDPDFFRIEKDRLEAASAALGGGDALDVAYSDILFLQTLIDAALEYSARKSTGDSVSVPQERLEALNSALSDAAQSLFGGKASQGGA